MVMSNRRFIQHRYVSSQPGMVIKPKKSRVNAIIEHREKLHNREMFNSYILISIGLVFVIGLFVLVINSGNLTLQGSNYGSSFERLLKDR